MTFCSPFQPCASMKTISAILGQSVLSLNIFCEPQAPRDVYFISPRGFPVSISTDFMGLILPTFTVVDSL